jgi:hypothetical protein
MPLELSVLPVGGIRGGQSSGQEVIPYKPGKKERRRCLPAREHGRQRRRPTDGATSRAFVGGSTHTGSANYLEYLCAQACHRNSRCLDLPPDFSRNLRYLRV